MILLRLFFEFFKVGLFAVGGGMATIPFLYEMSDKTGWFTHLQVADMLAISESTPGPIGVNMATYVGFTVDGVPGAVIATLGLVTPSIIVILIIAGMLQKFRSSPYVAGAFYGLRPASAGLITAAGIGVVKIALFNTERFAATGLFADLVQWKPLVLAAVVLVLTNFVKPTKKLHPIIFILASAVAGVVFGFAGV